MLALLRALLVLGVAGVTTVVVFQTTTEAENGVRKPMPLDSAIPIANLRQLCRDGDAKTAEQSNPSVDDILENHAQAREACDRLVEMSGLKGRDLAEVLLDRADLEAAGQAEAYAEALADYKRAIAIAPDFASAYWRRGKANLLYGRDLPAALNDLDEAIRLDPLRAAFFVTRASILGWLGEPDRAMADLNHALSVEPNSVHALTNRGLAFANQGDVARALRDYDAALILTPDDAGLYGFRAAARRQAGDEAGAKADDAKMAELMFSAGQ